VIHSTQRMIACRAGRASRTAEMRVDLHVALMPWRTMVDGDGM
jgi:hypothetical protein